MRKLALFVLGVAVLSCCSALAFAAEKPAPLAPATVTLAADPFVAIGDVNTKVPMVPRCPCTIIIGCAYQQIGYDCAEPALCCSCRGSNPALRQCVGVPPS